MACRRRLLARRRQRWHDVLDRVTAALVRLGDEANFRWDHNENEALWTASQDLGSLLGSSGGCNAGIQPGGSFQIVNRAIACATSNHRSLPCGVPAGNMIRLRHTFLAPLV
jgi:hypothetical protein